MASRPLSLARGGGLLSLLLFGQILALSFIVDDSPASIGPIQTRYLFKEKTLSLVAACCTHERRHRRPLTEASLTASAA